MYKKASNIIKALIIFLELYTSFLYSLYVQLKDVLTKSPNTYLFVTCNKCFTFDGNLSVFM